MKDTLRVGLRHELTETVTEELSPPHLAPMVVLSTPSMIGLMEMASLLAAQPHLDDGETTVGTHVNVSHERAARGGEVVMFTSEILSINKRRMTFAVRASVGEHTIGQGTHERAVIDTNRQK